MDWNRKQYALGYLLTDNQETDLRKIGMNPEYWKENDIGQFKIYVHEEESIYSYEKDKTWFVLIGHAYNPFSMQKDEMSILETLAAEYNREEAYRDYFDQLTGVFEYFVIKGTEIRTICDCAGMMGAYYGVINGFIYCSSHAQMIAELNNLKEDPYISTLKKTRTFHLYGLYLPSDYSPYREIKRVLPNVEVLIKNQCVVLNRFYPRKQYRISTDYEQVVDEVANLLHNNLVLISRKWKNPAISLTGGTDSKTTLACANDVQDCFLYYSYISLPREATDACAAQSICKKLNLRHEIYEINSDPTYYSDFSIVDGIIERNYGYLGKGNSNDVCKRISLVQQFHSDIEVKSWVSEIARGSRYTKYNKERLPEKMTPRMLTSMYKIFTYDRWNAVKTDKAFAKYLNDTSLRNRIEQYGYPWSEFFVWEIVFGGWGGLTLSCEHKVSNNITVPYNNRAILDLMLRTPLEKRKTDQLHRDIMDHMDPRINQLGIHVVNGNETKKRAILEGMYFDIHSHLPL